MGSVWTVVWVGRWAFPRIIKGRWWMVVGIGRNIVRVSWDGVVIDMYEG